MCVYKCICTNEYVVAFTCSAPIVHRHRHRHRHDTWHGTCANAQQHS